MLDGGHILESIIGVNLSHNPSAVLVENGFVKCAFEEEKLKQEKGFVGFPELSISECLKQLSIDSELTCVAVGFSDFFEICTSHRSLLRIYQKKRWRRGKFLLFDIFRIIRPLAFDPTQSLGRHLNFILEDIFQRQVTIRFFNHHEAHAASCLRVTNWKDVFVVTMDGKGDGLCGSISVHKSGKLVEKANLPQLFSLGQLYASTTSVLGFKPNRHEGKITGLAAFGNPEHSLKLLEDLFCFDGKLSVINQISTWKPKEIYTHMSKNRRLYGLNRRWIRTESNKVREYQLHSSLLHQSLQRIVQSGVSREDLAAGVQSFCEMQVIRLLKPIIEKYPEIEKICLAGGLFANVKINQRVRETFGFKDFFVQPAMDDAGTALGAAFLASTFKDNGNQDFSLATQVYLGSSFSEQEIESNIQSRKMKSRKTENPGSEIAKLLIDNKFVGIFQGKAEWGPRALGNRSILASATSNEVSVKLNERLGRNDFMPFAPLVLLEDARVFFKNFSPQPVAGKFMTITADVREEMWEKFPAVVHIDGTARPQIVDPQELPLIGSILKNYKLLSGLGVLMNTSFNLHESPIVSHPLNAIETYLKGAIDVLYIEGFLLQEEDRVQC